MPAPDLSPPVVHVIVDAGHGFSNKTPGKFDDGAITPFGVEHAIVSGVVDSLIAANDAAPIFGVEISETPRCDEECLLQHPNRSHLAWKVDWINHHLHPNDVLISLHCNCADTGSATGVEVYYSKLSPKRKEQALAILHAVASHLGLPARGAFPSDRSQHSSLAILDKTKPAAFLIELGFLSNARDTATVKRCGAGAVIDAIVAIRGNR